MLTTTPYGIWQHLYLLSLRLCGPQLNVQAPELTTLLLVTRISLCSRPAPFCPCCFPPHRRLCRCCISSSGCLLVIHWIRILSCRSRPTNCNYFCRFRLHMS